MGLSFCRTPFRVRDQLVGNPGLTDICRSTLGFAAQPLAGLNGPATVNGCTRCHILYPVGTFGAATELASVPITWAATQGARQAGEEGSKAQSLITRRRWPNEHSCAVASCAGSRGPQNRPRQENTEWLSADHRGFASGSPRVLVPGVKIPRRGFTAKAQGSVATPGNPGSPATT